MCRIAEASGASAAVPCNHWARGGRGSVELARAVKEAAAQENNFRFLYSLQVRPQVLIDQTKLFLFLLDSQEYVQLLSTP